jgi:transcriptional regulator with XRE-family HTH domain
VVHSHALGLRLIAAREAMGLSQRAVARAARVDQSTLVRLEAGRCRPSAETLDLLSRFFDVSMDHLWRGTDDPVDPL